METGAFWDGLRSETVTLQDAQGRILTAHGGGPLDFNARRSSCALVMPVFKNM
jgi:hypothetical protein